MGYQLAGPLGSSANGKCFKSNLMSALSGFTHGSSLRLILGNVSNDMQKKKAPSESLMVMQREGLIHW